MTLATTYMKFELLRTFRNVRFFIFSFAFPLLMYFLLVAPNKDEKNFGNSGISAPLYYMVGLAAFGTMIAVMAGGARIAAERSVGWNRQLRLTPLTPRNYFRAKIATSYVMALVSLALLYLAGISFGVRLPFDKWLQMTGLILIALVPFAALGIMLGHLLTVDSMGPALGGLTSLFAFLGGTWFPLSDGLKTFGELLPSYWLVQAGRVGLGGHAWTSKGWIVIAVWTVALAVLAVRAYQRDTKRV
jgi:ABC-2 type transport system permease protein